MCDATGKGLKPIVKMPLETLIFKDGTFFNSSTNCWYNWHTSQITNDPLNAGELMKMVQYLCWLLSEKMFLMSMVSL